MLTIKKLSFAAAGFVAAGSCAVAAEPTRFGFKQIVVNGTTSVSATVINNKGAIAGTYYINGYGYGFVQSGGVTATLPAALNCPDIIQNMNSCIPTPTAINGAGTVAGAWYNPEDNVIGGWEGFALPAKSVTYNDIGYIGRNLAMPMNSKGDVAFAIYVYLVGSLTDILSYGPPSSLTNLPAPENPAVSSINIAQWVAGTENGTINGVQTSVGFEIRNGVAGTIVPPGAVGVRNAIINDHGVVAGSYKDASQRDHGFLFDNGKYTSFDMPVATDFVRVTGINDTGRVVGYFESGDSRIHPFLYNGSTVTIVGGLKYDGTGLQAVAINDLGVMLLQFGFGSTAASYRVLCAGPGC